MMRQKIVMWMEPFYKASVSWHGKNVEAQALNITLHVLHLTVKTNILSEQGHIAH